MKNPVNGLVLAWALAVTAFLLMGLSLPGAPFSAGNVISSAEVNAKFAALEAAVTALETSAPPAVEQRIANLETTVQSYVDVLPLAGAGQVYGFQQTTDRELVLVGMNLHVRNTQGSTQTKDGYGNVIIGYNEPRTDDGDPMTDDSNDRSGSHYLVVGQEQNFSRFGGIVASRRNTSDGDFACVTGGHSNIASGSRSSITGGQHGRAPGIVSSIGGGFACQATATLSTASGGNSVTASGFAQHAP